MYCKLAQERSKVAHIFHTVTPINPASIFESSEKAEVSL